MTAQANSTDSKLPAVFVFIATIALALAILPLHHATSAQDNTSDPWSKSQVIRPPDLVRELSDTKNAPTVVFVGFHTLYEGGHIKGASFHGTASSEKGLAELKTWAGTLRRSTNLVVYCGCCPLERCPNIRPAFTTLREMGFSKLRVLVLPTDFATDWVAKGYPYDKGK
jgi:thiosulfate/3-mercaptopyruvate sulfurtransferase